MKKQLGVTLVELLTALAILAILLGVAVPSFKYSIIKNRLATQLDELYVTIIYARSEAVSRAGRLTLCASSDQSACLTGSGTQSWSGGWLLFVDEDGDGVRDSGDAILRANTALAGATALTWNNGARLTFNNLGSTSQAGTFKFCESGGDASYAKSIIISLSGRARRDSRTSGGGALTC